MKNQRKILISVVLFLLIFSSSTLFLESVHSRSSTYLSSVYILSEGGFSAGSSKLSLYNPINNNYFLNVFSPGNLGLYPDGLIFYQNYLYLLEQGNYGGQGKIYKLDTNGAVQNSNSFGVNPYSLAVANNKIYTTNGGSGKVSVLDLNTLTVIKQIQSGVYPQEIISFNNKVYVCNTSIYGGASDSTITVIDAITDSVITKINLSKDPSSISLTTDGKLLAGCQGAAGKIYKIDPLYNTIIVSYSPPSGFDKDISVDINSNYVYYINYSNSISKLDLSNSQVTTVINNPNPAAVYFYGYAYDYTSGKHFIADAKNFTISGSLNVYNAAGVLQNSYSTGLAPRRILLKYLQTTSVNQTSEVVSGLKLYQNYPNPFNPSTTIKYELSKKSKVSLKIFDVTGREITELVNSMQREGVYSVKFDAAGLSSGIYVCLLKAGESRITTIMTLVK